MPKIATPRIQATKNYRMFERSSDNRAIDEKKHRKLKESMQRYGFLKSFPISCSKNGSSRLKVNDGQHRLAFAETLGLPVFYVVDDVDYDVAMVNSTARTWAPVDYARKYADNGNAHYTEGLAFAETHRLPIGLAFRLLAGTTTFSNIQDAFHEGRFAVKDRDWADAVASTYTAMIAVSKQLRSARFVEAVMAACRVDGFDPSRLIHGAEKCREKLGSYSTRDGYLEMMEDIYNHGRHKLFPLKISALQAMKARNAAKK